MSLMRWDPFVDVRRTMDRLLEESLWPWRVLRRFEEPVLLPIDMYQTEDNVVVKASLPGVKPEDLEVTVTGDTLNIRGEAKVEEECREEDYLCRERRYSSFSRSITLPGSLNADKAEAKFENGVLTLTIPRVEEVKPKTIKVAPKAVVEGEKKKPSPRKKKS